MVLVDQPSAAPTRKWTAATISEVIASVGGLFALFGTEVVSTDEAQVIGAGAIAAVVVLGRLVAYFTKNRG